MPKQVNLHDGQWRGAFDSKGRAIILVAGDKTGGSQKRFYEQLIAKADKRFSAHLDRLASAKKDRS